MLLTSAFLWNGRLENASIPTNMFNIMEESYVISDR